jgi:hypothetical protein
MLPTGGDGSAVIQWNATSKQWEIKVGNTNKVTVARETITLSPAVTFSSDVTIPGGAPQTFMFAKEYVLQGATTQMTASIMSGATEELIQTRYPMVRSGSILGLTLYSEQGLVLSGTNSQLTASVTLDGANVAATVILGTGSVGHFITAKDTSGLTFNGGQTIGVSLTASDAYESQHSVRLASVSASWTAAVLVEF